ncbi:MAG: thioredoxin domain-containing protein [Flavobacteriaceae bacterium]
MKTTLLLFTFVSIIYTTQAQLIIKTDGTEKLLGKVSINDLTKNSFKEWHSVNYESYLVHDKIITQLKDSLKNYTIKAFFGSWCSDSKKELPRFLKVLEAANFPTQNIEIVALDNQSSTYKQSPSHEEKDLNIHRVPTFIFYKDGKEVNRIVEHPKETFERDILSIVLENHYNSNYFAVNYLENRIAEIGLDSIRKQKDFLLYLLPEYLKGSRELNTYGYVNLRAKNIDKALFIFELNANLFPRNPNVFDSLGEAYFEVKNFTEALKNYYKVLSLEPDNKNAATMIEKIKQIEAP